MNNWNALVSGRHEKLPTRRSLLSRLKNWNDNESWNVFFETYWRLIYTAALKAGLTEAEAEDVVQETILSVSKTIPEFQYDPGKGTFKAWLMHLTSWRIADQFRRRQRNIQPRRAKISTSTKTDTLEGAPDPAAPPLEAIWDQEWEKNMMEAAVERVKKRVDPKYYQAFDLYVLRKWPVSRVTSTLKVNRGKVYLAKHRISQLIKKEIALLRAKPI